MLDTAIAVYPLAITASIAVVSQMLLYMCLPYFAVLAILYKLSNTS